MSDYSCILTNIGRAQIANAQLPNDVILITHMAVGDGAGLPNQNMTALRNEKWRGAVVRRALSPNDNTVLEVEGHIPPEIGGFTIREAGLFNEDGNLVAVASLPESYKPVLAEGSGVDTLIKLITAVENADNITLKLDPAIITASRSWVMDILMERDMAIASAHMMAARNLLDNDLQETLNAERDNKLNAVLAQLVTLTLHQSIIADRASRAVLN